MSQTFKICGVSKRVTDYSHYLRGTKLKPEQNEAIERMVQSRNIILGHQAGLGKTTSSLTAARVVMERNPSAVNVIFQPKSARAAFKKELKNRIVAPYALISTEETIPYSGQDYVMIEQSVLHKNADLVSQIAQRRPIIATVDEAHVLQNPKNTVSRTLDELRPMFVAEWLLTATPLLNSIEGLFHVCKHVDPSGLPNWWEFRSQYCVTKPRDVRYGGHKRTIQEIVDYKNLDLLRQYLETLVITGSIPYDIKYYRVKVELDEQLKEAYNKASKGVFDSKYMGEKDFGARLHDLQRIVDGSHHDLLKGKLTSKEKALMFRIRQIMSRGESCLVYTEYEESVDRLAQVVERLKDWAGVKRVVLLTGATKEVERVAIEQNMVPQEVVIVTQAGRQSRNLQKANHLILYNTPFSVGNITQLIGRICRVDTTFATQHVHLLETVNTIDEYKVALFYDNIWLINQLFGNMGTLPTDFIRIDRDNMAQLKRRFLWNKRR